MRAGRLRFGWFALVLCCGCFSAPPPAPSSPPAVSAAAPGADTVSLVCIGDILLHMPVVAAGRDTAGYDFTPMFAHIRATVAAADLATVVLETPLSDTRAPWHGFPLFNTPREIATSVQAIGFDVAFTATNHCLDRGETGLRRTMAHCAALGLAQSGLRPDTAAPPFVLKRVRNLTVAFLGYTTTTNCLPLPAGRPWLVNIFSETAARADIAAARQAGADAVVLALHTGTEYLRRPSDQQRAEVAQLVAAGADVILGSHVHVAQPWELRTVTDTATGRSRQCFIAWSLGNALTNQQWHYSDYGLIATLELAKTRADSRLTITVREVAPLWTQRECVAGRWRYRLHQVTDAADTALLAPAALAHCAAICREYAALEQAWAGCTTPLSAAPTALAMLPPAPVRTDSAVAFAARRPAAPADSRSRPAATVRSDSRTRPGSGGRGDSGMVRAVVRHDTAARPRVPLRHDTVPLRPARPSAAPARPVRTDSAAVVSGRVIVSRPTPGGLP